MTDQIHYIPVTLRANALIGEKTEITIELVNKKWERITDTYPEIILSLSGKGEITRYCFTPGDRGLKKLILDCFNETGIFYILAQVKGKRKQWRSNPIAIGRYNPPYKLYWGEIHGHTKVSDSLGSLDDHYQFGRDVCALDIYAAADHTEFPKNAPMDTIKWEETCAAARKYYQPHKFVTLLGFEWTSGKFFSAPYEGYGHRNVYYLDDDQPYFCCNSPDCHTPQQLFQKLDSLNTQAIVIPHHPAVNSPNFWVNWDFYNAKYEPLVEIYSMWGNSERSVEDGNIERPVKRLGGTVETGQGNHVQDALRKGIRIGFIGGSDAHDGYGGRTKMHIDNPKTFQAGEVIHEGPFYPNGLMAVYAEELTRESVFQAMMKRRVYATTCARIMLKFFINDHWMGEELKLPSPDTRRTLNFLVAGTHTLERIEIVKNCVTIHTESPAQLTYKYEYTDLEPIKNGDFYYIRVLQRDGEMAWSSPIWIDIT